MEVILDTNALSDLGAAEPELLAALGTERHLLPVIVIGEYRFGLERSRLRKERLRWLDRATNIFEVIDVSLDTTEFYAVIRTQLQIAGTPIPENDIWIAAIALQTGQEVLSQDRHFDLVSGLQRVAW